MHVEGWLCDPIILALLGGCTSESTDPRPHFPSLQYRLCSLLLLATLLFFIVPITKINIYYRYYTFIIISSAELVHLYKLPLYLVCWGDKRLFIIWLQGCLRETIFILRLPQIDKTLGHPLERNLLLSYKSLRLEAQHECTRIKLRSRHQCA